MKPLYLFLLLSILSSIQINAQHLEIGNQWIYDHRDQLGGGHYIESIETMEIVSDTIINGLNYFKVVSSEESPCGYFLETEYLREDNGQIFRLNENHSDDNLMIDYTAVDPYEMLYETSWQGGLVTTNVVLDSTAIETLPNGKMVPIKYQRIINNLSFGDDEVYKLTDKAGYVQSGFLFPNIGTGLCDPEETQSFRCFISNNDTIRVTEYGCFEPSIKVSTKNITIDEISISPNPVKSQISLPIGFDKAVIYDLAGQRTTLQVENSSIDVSELKPGFYILYLNKNGSNDLSIAKFVKI